MKNRIIKFLGVTLLLSVLAAGCGKVAAKTASGTTTAAPVTIGSLSAVNTIGLHTVQIVFIAQNLANGQAVLVIPLGTGFLLNEDGYIITASHLLDLGQQYIQNTQAETSELSIEILPPSGRGYAAALPSIINDFSVVATDAAHDLALLKLKMPVLVIAPGNGGPMTIRYSDGSYGNLSLGNISFATNIATNTSVGLTGYPSNTLVPTTIKGEVTSAEISAAGIFTLTDTASLSPNDLSVQYSISGYYRTDIKAGAFLSGSPVYATKNEAILGICINTDGSAGTAVIVPSQYILDLMKNNNIAAN
jgi:Trypsin-like peptidase domain